MVTTRVGIDEIALSVADTGMGIPAAELPPPLPAVLPDRQATATAIPGTGLGLGLAIAKAIVEGHGGRIGVESEERAGTTFRIFLPR